MVVDGHEHFVKVKVHITKCSLDVQGFKDKSNKRFPHLENRTVGEYFAHVVIVNIVSKIRKLVDIIKLNDHVRVLASEGRKASKSKNTTSISVSCKVCGKDQRKDKTLQCSNCMENVHSSCLT